MVSCFAPLDAGRIFQYLRRLPVLISCSNGGACSVPIDPATGKLSEASYACICLSGYAGMHCDRLG